MTKIVVLDRHTADQLSKIYEAILPQAKLDLPPEQAPPQWERLLAYQLQKANPPKTASP